MIRHVRDSIWWIGPPSIGCSRHRLQAPSAAVSNRAIPTPSLISPATHDRPESRPTGGQRHTGRVDRDRYNGFDPSLAAWDHQTIISDEAITMSEPRDRLGDIISALKQERDEIQLQIHLANMEAKDDYDRISRKVDQLNDQYEPVKDAVEETTENVFTALGLVADELQEGFKRVRKVIREET